LHKIKKVFRGDVEMKNRKIIKIKLTEKSAQELVDLQLKLGLIYKGDAEDWLKFYMIERECLFG
jgi:hypothetical protein